MNVFAPLLPPPASDVAQRVDVLFYALSGVTGAVALAVTAVAVYFSVRYRRGSAADRSHPPAQNRLVELAWIFVPLAIFLAFYAWGAVLYADLYGRGDDAMTVYILGKQWMWKAVHANGRREINELHLPAGKPVRLVLASEDVIHSFFVPAFRIKQDAVPGRYTWVRFTPLTPGTYPLRCAEYCGTDHAHMDGRVVVSAPADFSVWLEQGGAHAGLAAQGFELYRRLGCSGCHEPLSVVHAPDLAGIYGRVVHLADGRTVTADEAYLRDSILLPKRDVVVGYEPVMPSFQGQVDQGDLLALIAFLKEKK